MKDKRRSQLRELSNLDAYQDRKFQNFKPSLPGVNEAFTAAIEFSLDPKGWLLLVGPNGCGKTHLALAIAHRRLEDGDVVLFSVVIDLLRHLRATFAPNATEVYDQLFSKMCEAGVLILDDLGAEQSSPWAKEKLFELLNYRYNMSMPTVITANPRGLQELDERVRSRLSDISLVRKVHMNQARDYRPNHPGHKE
jgi:DNA replication protein DnaC